MDSRVGQSVRIRDVGEKLVSHLPTFQPEVQPETSDRGEPGDGREGLVLDLDRDLNLDLAKNRPEVLVESLVRNLAKVFVPNEDENEPVVLALCKPNDRPAKEPADLHGEIPAEIPSPGRPTWVGCTAVTSTFPVSAYISCEEQDERSPEMAVMAARKGLNRDTRAMLEYIRRVRPVNIACRLTGGHPTSS